MPSTSGLTPHFMPAESPKDVIAIHQDTGSVKDISGWTWPELSSMQNCAQRLLGSLDSPAPLNSEDSSGRSELPEDWTEVCAADTEGDFTEETVARAESGGREDKSRVRMSHEYVSGQARCNAAQAYADPLTYMSLFV